jgi:hypothetical protein
MRLSETTLLVPIDRSAYTGGIVLLIVGAVVFALWWLLTRRRRAWFHRRVEVEGTVTSVTKHADFSRTPSLEYVDQHGATHPLGCHVSSPGYRIGDKLTVYYDPEQPQVAICKDDLMFVRIAAIASVVMIVTGAGCLIAYFAAT